MPSAAESPLSFEPPRAGSWTLDTAHFPRPATRFVIELFPEPARRGFKEATARYGLLLDHIEWAFVHRWAYLCPRPIPLLEDGRPSKEAWDELVRSSSALGERLQRSARVFDDRRWRDDVKSWDGDVKPRMRRRHLHLQGIEPSRLEAGELASHIDACRDNLRQAVYEHHRLNVAPVIPVGDFLVRAQQWTGRSTAELVGLVHAGGPVSLGAAAELNRVAEAIRGDATAAAALSGHHDAPATLASLSSRPGEVGRAAADYVGLVGWWSAGSGSDVGEPCLLEVPRVLVEAIRAALERAGDGGPADASDERAGQVRAAVPREQRSMFDELLREAGASHRVRDERAIYCDVWAYGLARRAILAAGTRLAEAGAVEQPAHLVEAGYVEMRSLLEGSSTSAPSRAELAERARYREEASEDEVPVVLGAPPRSPVPIEWLPPGAARTEGAFRAYVGAMSGEAEAPASAGAVRGVGASPGRYEGRARVVRSASELARIEKGDVLVTGATTPAFNVVLPLVGAIVTDRGGLLSHAAIVAREYRIPAVVGTGDASRTIPEGAVVVVDGATGEVALLA